MTSKMIEARGVERTYKKGPYALKGIDLEVGSGSRFALLGPNGAGKSTLIRILCTLSKMDAGTVSIDGIPVEGNTAAIRERIGVALQDIQIDPEESARGQLIFQGRLYGMNKRQATERAAEIEERFGLREFADRRAKDLSGGNQRRLHVALALVHRPRVLFLDEPTVGMDPEIRVRFWEEMRRLNAEDGITIFFSTQYLEEAERHGRELAVINEGVVAWRGGIDRFIAEHSLSEDGLEEGYLRFLERKHQEEAVHA